jgi:uroporphyrinogen decarboxylase
MTHRERVLAALSHRQPDKVPIDLGSTINGSMVVDAYDRLKQHYNFKAPTTLCNRLMQAVQIDEEILQTMDIDTRAVFVGAPANGETELGSNRYRDFWGVERVKPESSYYYDLTKSPLSGEITVSDIVNYSWPDPDDPGFVKGLKSRVQWLREHTDCAIVLSLPPAFIHPSQFLRGFEDWYCDFALNTKLMGMLFDAILEITLQISKNALNEVGREVDVVCFAEDIGAQHGLPISYGHYIKYIKPRHGKYCGQIRDLSAAKLLYHSCGSIKCIIDDLIDIGVEALNPIQVTASGMDPGALKKTYGHLLAFWGGVDVQYVLPRGTKQDVRNTVETLIEQLGEGGGYILSATHNIQPDIPLDNVLTMFEYARAYQPSFL